MVQINRLNVKNPFVLDLNIEILDVIENPSSKFIEDNDSEEITICVDQNKQDKVPNGNDNNIQDPINSHHNEINNIRYYGQT